VFRWSWSLNAVLLGQRASWLVLDALRRLDRGVGRERETSGARPAREASGAPGAWRSTVALASCYWRVLSEAVRRALLDERWRLLLVEAQPIGASPRAPLVIEPPADSYWADPFVVRRGAASYIFFEQYLYGEGRGVISYVVVPDDALTKPVLRPEARRLLDDGHHLSYPFLWRRNGDLFMIPESSAVGRVDLWRCVDFPDVWRKEKTLLDGVSAADTSLLHWQGKWWLFTNIDRSGVGDHRSELHVYLADDPVQGEADAPQSRGCDARRR
jgi:hypothetical protein